MASVVALVIMMRGVVYSAHRGVVCDEEVHQEAAQHSKARHFLRAAYEKQHHEDDAEKEAKQEPPNEVDAAALVLGTRVAVGGSGHPEATP